MNVEKPEVWEARATSAVWQSASRLYRLSNGEAVSTRAIIAMRQHGRVTCYGGPLDHIRPTMERTA